MFDVLVLVGSADGSASFTTPIEYTVAPLSFIVFAALIAAFATEASKLPLPWLGCPSVKKITTLLLSLLAGMLAICDCAFCIP